MWLKAQLLTLTTWIEPLRKIAQNMKIVQKPHLPEEFHKGKDNLAKNLSKITLRKILVRLAYLMKKEIKSTMNNEQ